MPPRTPGLDEVRLWVAFSRSRSFSALLRNRASPVRAWSRSQTPEICASPVRHRYVAADCQSRPNSPGNTDLSSRQRTRRVAVFSTAGDRKSTRLNSSHLVISYAVFCLKKKNKPTADTHLWHR